MLGSSKCGHLCSRKHRSPPGLFLPPKRTLSAHQTLPVASAPDPDSQGSALCFYEFGCAGYLLSVESHSIGLPMPGLLHSAPCPPGSSPHRSACQNLLPLHAEEHAPECIDHILRSRCSTDGHLGRFHLLATVNNCSFNLNTYLFEREGERESTGTAICWFTPQMSTVALGPRKAIQVFHLGAGTNCVRQTQLPPGDYISTKLPPGARAGDLVKITHLILTLST